MKTIRFTGLVLIALSLSARLLAQDAKQQLVVPLSDSGKPYKLTVDIVTGSIKVIPYEGKDVIIEAQSEQRRHEDRNQGGMHRISGGDNLDVTARERNNAVTIGTDMPNRMIELTIKIPAGATNVKLSTVNGGPIIASDLNGDIEANNTNGAIKLTNVSGSVVATTTNGNVQVVFKSIDTKAAMAFTTLNGNVDITLPASLKANVKARSDMGNVYSDFEMVTEKSPAKNTKTTAKDGMYRITIEDWVYGKINGGGPEFLFKNMNGNIYIRKAK